MSRYGSSVRIEPAFDDEVIHKNCKKIRSKKFRKVNKKPDAPFAAY